MSTLTKNPAALPCLCLLLLALPASAQVPPQAKTDPQKPATEDKIRAALISCMKVGAEPEGRKVCARALKASKALAKTRQLPKHEETANQVEAFMASLDRSSGTKTGAQLEADFDAIAKGLPVREFKPEYVKYFAPPAPPQAAGAAGAAKKPEAPGKLGPQEEKALLVGPEKEKALKADEDSMAQALLPTKKEESLPASPAKAEEPWRADAQEMYKIWTCRHPRTADMALCEFAARELSAHNIPWRIALANWDFATDLLPSHRYSKGGMTAEGLTDASWTWCKGHREVVRGLLGRPGERSDLYNPRASILWWIAEYEEHAQKMGKKADPWRVAAGVFLPAAPYSDRAEDEMRGWKDVAAKQDRCLVPAKKSKKGP
ncbi:MAG: hypothetical protein NTY77_19050 [Elusimicrobia bacterium]|nr:hypothetical protein [Elusimicrobiota bacterium]